MSMKVEVDAVDAELIAVLRKHKASSSMSWDVTLAPGITMKVDISYPLTHSIPDRIISAVTTCIADSINAAKPPPVSEDV
jgi:uncharacterized protein YejL (UPF0352 family)